MTQIRLDVNEYTLRVLDVMKGKFGLKNRSAALNRFALEQGQDYVDPIIDERILASLDSTYSEHIKKNKNRKMTEKELNNILDM